jgi:hypothetical protein
LTESSIGGRVLLAWRAPMGPRLHLVWRTLVSSVLLWFVDVM